MAETDFLAPLPAAVKDRVLDAAKTLREVDRLMVFTGAGVSAESGIATFRDRGGLWEKYPPDAFATMSGLAKTLVARPDHLAAFLRDVLHPIAGATPNAGHHAIAELQEHIREVIVVTQNVDNLHQEAGSTKVREVHGSLFRIASLAGDPIRQLDKKDMHKMLRKLERVTRGPFKLPRLIRAMKPMLGVTASMSLGHRPNVVLMGEQMAEPDWSHAKDAAESCDAVLVVGTSGTIYPAAHLPEVASARGARVIGVGPEEGDADLWLLGPAGELLPWVLRAMATGTL